jgi:hypothetical protein
LGRTTQTLDHVVVVHILIWDKRKSQINEYSDTIWNAFNECLQMDDGFESYKAYDFASGGIWHVQCHFFTQRALGWW